MKPSLIILLSLLALAAYTKNLSNGHWFSDKSCETINKVIDRQSTSTSIARAGLGKTAKLYYISGVCALK